MANKTPKKTSRRAGAKRRPAPTARAPRGPAPGTQPWSLRQFQRHIEAIYGTRDRERGLAATFMWFAEEVGELSRALRSTDRSNLRGEIADTLAWLMTLASIADIDVETCVSKYAAGCPRCLGTPCRCAHRSHAVSRRK